MCYYLNVLFQGQRVKMYLLNISFKSDLKFAVIFIIVIETRSNFR